MTIARHFNAGFNPQIFQVPQGRPAFSNEMMNDGNHAPSVQPSRWDWWPCASTPALKRRAIVELSRWDERGRMGRALPIPDSAGATCRAEIR